MRSAHRVTTMGIISVTVCLLWAACFAAAARASVDYMSASFVDTRYGWVAGIDNVSVRTEVWRTHDGGVTWKKVGSSVAAGGGIGCVSQAARSRRSSRRPAWSRTAGAWRQSRYWRLCRTGVAGCRQPSSEACTAVINPGVEIAPVPE